jgi:hypothetical protein
MGVEFERLVMFEQLLPKLQIQSKYWSGQETKFGHFCWNEKTKFGDFENSHVKAYECILVCVEF